MNILLLETVGKSQRQMETCVQYGFEDSVMAKS